MNKEYIDLAKVTCSNDSFTGNKASIMHMIVGMLSEYGELIFAINNCDKVNIMEECGDCLWYLGNLNRLLIEEGLLKDFVNTNSISKNDANILIFHCSNFSDLLKKYCVYNKELSESNKENLFELLNSYYSTISAILLANGFTIEYAMKKNIEKLKARFPDGFSEFYANNRNLTNELNILSNNK